MPAPISLTSTLKLAKQASKGTAASTDFLCGRYTTSSMQPIFDYIEATDEHFCGVNPRATTRKALSRPSGYVGAFGGMGFVYPEVIGLVLRGMGFKAAAPAGTGDAQTHVFTLDERANAPWMTVLHGIGDGAARFERRLTDARIEMLRLDASVRGLQQTFTGYGITEDAAVGTETSTNETDAMLLPSRGTATVKIEGVGFTSAFRTMRFQIANQLDRSQQQLFTFKRDDLPTQGLDITGILGQIDLDYTTYKKLNWGGASGTTPVAKGVKGDVSFKFESAEIAETGTPDVPYSLEFVLPSIELRMGNFQSRGRDLIRFDLNFMMIDDTTDPVTVNLVNKRSTQY